MTIKKFFAAVLIFILALVLSLDGAEAAIRNMPREPDSSIKRAYYSVTNVYTGYNWEEVPYEGVYEGGVSGTALVSGPYKVYVDDYYDELFFGPPYVCFDYPAYAENNSSRAIFEAIALSLMTEQDLNEYYSSANWLGNSEHYRYAVYSDKVGDTVTINYYRSSYDDSRSYHFCIEGK